MFSELIPIIGIIFGTLLVAFVFGRITGLIKQAMKNRNERKYSSQDKEEILREFERFREKTERRLQNLEAIVTDEENEELGEQKAASQKGYSRSNSGQSAATSNRSQKTIKMEEDQELEQSNENSYNNKKNRKQSSSSSKLNNMLKS